MAAPHDDYLPGGTVVMTGHGRVPGACRASAKCLGLDLGEGKGTVDSSRPYIGPAGVQSGFPSDRSETRTKSYRNPLFLLLHPLWKY